MKTLPRPSCERCGHVHAPPVPLRCQACGAWDSVQEAGGEAPILARKPSLVVFQGGRSRGGTLSEEDDAPIGRGAPKELCRTVTTGDDQLDQLFGKNAGGGLPLGSVFLLAGPPGAGKSTLLANVADQVGEGGARVLIGTSEEDREDVDERARRLEAVHPNVFLVATKEIESVERSVLRRDPDVVILDSISTMCSRFEPGAAGTPSVLRAVGERLVRMAKGARKRAVIVVAHVIKDGDVAGPMAMQHLFDGTFYFEECSRSLRVLRSIKNRRAPTGTMAFEMREGGVVPLENPSAHLLADRARGLAGSVVAAACGPESSRAMLVEVQARVGPAILPKEGARFSRPKVATEAKGVDRSRMPQIRMVVDEALEKVVGAPCFFDLRDVVVNVPGAGSVAAKDPAIDLAIAVAMVSSAARVPVGDDLAVFGELGLATEVRAVPQSFPRVLEAKTLGFRRLVAPRGALEDATEASKSLGRRGARKKFDVFEAEHLAEALEEIFGAAALACLAPELEERPKKGKRR